MSLTFKSYYFLAKLKSLLTPGMTSLLLGYGRHCFRNEYGFYRFL